MKRKTAPKPTAAESELLSILWRLKAATVREVQAAWRRKPPAGYTTVLKFLQIMTGKGLVTREEQGRAHVYRPAVPQEETQGQMVRDLLDRVFGGSAAQLVMRALSERRASRREIDEIRDMLDRMERGDKP